MRRISILERKKMNVLYTTNDRFVDKVAAGICSVFENNREVRDLTVYIIGQNISEKNQAGFRKMEKRYNRRICLIPLGDLSGYFDFEFDTLGWDPVILARLLLDQLLPEDVDRILYLDGDTINIRGLEKLWETDLEGCAVGACIEATIDRKRKAQLGMQDAPYINSGVLLFDLVKWRDGQYGKKIIEYYKECQGKLFAADQDIINVVLQNKIYYLPPKYNFYNIYWFYPYRFLKKLMGSAYYYDRETFDESLKHPVIIHYLGEERPWRKGNTHKFRRYYEKYHSRTPWKNEPEETGWEVYFFCWNIFNAVMRPFPAVRYQIINGLIPWFMKWRKKQLNREKK